MEIISLTNQNGLIKGEVSISEEYFNRDHFGRNVVCYRESENSFSYVGKMDVNNMRIIHLEMLLFDDQQSFDLYVNLGHDNVKFIGTLYRSVLESYSSYSSSSTNYSVDDDISWWEFGHTDEFFLKSLILLPIRLTVYIVLFLLGLFVGLPIMIILSILIIFVSFLVLFPIKTIIYIISFGHWDLFETRLLHRLRDLWGVI